MSCLGFWFPVIFGLVLGGIMYFLLVHDIKTRVVGTEKKEVIDAKRISKVVHEDHIYTYSGEDVDLMDKESLVKACKDLIRHGDLNGYI